MDIDELISRATNEGERTISRTVAPLAPDLIAKVHASGGMRLTDVLSASARAGVKRDVRYRHIFGEPARDDAIEAWRRTRPAHPLPADLTALLRHVNGIHLWAEEEIGRSYFGLAPIEEWELARVKMFGPASEPDLLDDRFIAVTYHDDNAAFVALDVTSGTYYLMDTAGPDTSTPIARDVDELLDWLWRSRLEPK